MLQQLAIQNYALIRGLDIQPDKGLNIITGETGAGKSIMLGAIGLLLGNRADAKVMFDENVKCVVEGFFEIKNYGLEPLFAEEDIDYEPTCVIRREIAPGGKSRAFINDTPVRLELLKKVVEQLMDIHSQHDTLLLGSNAYQVKLLDDYAMNKPVLLSYQQAFSLFKKTEKKYEEAKTSSANAQKELDFNTFLFNELEELNPQTGEQDTAEADLKLLENAEEIKSKFAQVADILSVSEQALLPQLKVALTTLEAASKIYPQAIELVSRLQTTYVELKDIATEVEDLETEIEFNPEKINHLQNRLNLIYKLQQKHQVKTIEELIEIKNQLETKIQQVQNLDDEIIQLEQELKVLQTDLQEKAQLLTQSRLAVSTTMADKLTIIVKELGMPEANVLIVRDEVEYSSTGIDKISFLFSANKGVQAQELKTAASGGEFSRLMLGVKYLLAGKTSLPTIIFDEIDTGISGEIALKVGKLIRRMAEKHQIICITHMPQMASQAHTHYYVYKDHNADRTISKIKELTHSERVSEIAQMIGGANPSASALASAEEMIVK